MTKINAPEESNDVVDHRLPKVVITRRSPKDIIKVCPLCFSPVRYVGHIFEFLMVFECTNRNCGWKGKIAVEVTKDDYIRVQKKLKDRVEKNADT